VRDPVRREEKNSRRKKKTTIVSRNKEKSNLQHRKKREQERGLKRQKGKRFMNRSSEPLEGEKGTRLTERKRGLQKGKGSVRKNSLYEKGRKTFIVGSRTNSPLRREIFKIMQSPQNGGGRLRGKGKEEGILLKDWSWI